MVWDVEAEGFGSLGSSPGAGRRRELRQPLPREMIQEHLAEVMDVLVWFVFLSVLWMTFLLVLCSFAACFNNPFLPIAQWFLFSCRNRAAAFITRANIAACASSFPFVMV